MNNERIPNNIPEANQQKSFTLRRTNNKDLGKIFSIETTAEGIVLDEKVIARYVSRNQNDYIVGVMEINAGKVGKEELMTMTLGISYECQLQVKDYKINIMIFNDVRNNLEPKFSFRSPGKTTNTAPELGLQLPPMQIDHPAE